MINSLNGSVETLGEMRTATKNLQTDFLELVSAVGAFAFTSIVGIVVLMLPTAFTGMTALRTNPASQIVNDRNEMVVAFMFAVPDQHSIAFVNESQCAAK